MRTDQKDRDTAMTDVQSAQTPRTDAAQGKPDGADQAESGAVNLAASTIPADELEQLTEDIVAALKTVYDPEIPVDIYELGLIYKVDIDDDRKVSIHMTLTAPGCPVAGEMPGWVENAVAMVPGVSDVQVEMVFDPPWTPERMSEEAQVAIGWF